MAVTADTLRLIEQLRVQVSWQVDTATRDLITAWSRAWDEVAREWRAAALAYEQAAEVAAATGKTIPVSKVLRAERATRALAVTRQALAGLSQHTGVRVLQTVGEVVQAADSWQQSIWATQLPPGNRAGAAVGWNRPDPEALAAIVKRSTQQVTVVTYPLEAEATEQMKRSIVRAVAVGQNPRDAAARMVAAATGGFNGGLVRAMVIARTEILDAHRAASLASRAANADVVRGWVWVAQLGHRTCPACWAKHGSEHPATEPGPHDHHQGRCTAAPLSRSWRDLGFDVDEPASVLPDARAAFWQMPEHDQLRVMGPTRLDWLKSGRITWDDLPQLRHNPDWRDAWHPTPVRDLPNRTGGAAP